jgi:hypothetical protein
VKYGLSTVLATCSKEFSDCFGSGSDCHSTKWAGGQIAIVTNEAMRQEYGGGVIYGDDGRGYGKCIIRNVDCCGHSNGNGYGSGKRQDSGKASVFLRRIV